MPPAPSRDIFVILLDLQAKPISSALHALSDVVLYKQLSQSKDQYKLYLVNATKTSNNLGYKGICSLDATTSLGNLLEEISAIETEPNASDWLEALELGLEELKIWSDSPGVITLQILFISDLISFERPNDGKLLEKLIQDIQNMDVFLYIIGPSVEPQKTICHEDDVAKWMASLKVDKDNSNQKIAKKIMKHTPHTVMCSYEIGVHLFQSLKYHKGTQPWLVPLTFGTLLNIPASTIRLTKREPPFRLKSTTVRRNFGGDVKWAYEDQQDVMIDYRDTVSGVIKHGKFVKIESDGRFKIEGPRSFQALAFTESKNIPEYLLQSDGSYFVMANPKEPDYFKFFAALVDELAEANMCVLARRVYNKDFNPKFVALIPNTKFNVKGFILCQLPYADDLAHVYNEKDIALAPKVEANQKIYSFLDSLNVTSEDCQVKVPLAPTMMIYSNAFGIINKVEEKCLKENYLEEKFDKTKVDLLNFDYLKNDWPIRELEKVKKEETSLADFDDVGDFSFS